MADIDSDEEIKVRMKRPTLLRQLQTILSTYPDDAQILRELVQNAEDAGAGCMKIFYDNRNIDPGGNSTIKQYFKSPGICVYNDAMFTEKDWEGIITIYDSVKEKEPLKVGRFGLGFKSVFHMTDTPIIISGNKVLIIDPIKSEKNEEECSIIPIKSLKKKHSPRETLGCILDRFHFDDTVLDSGQYKGTMFWFPLRQQKSSLSSTIYSEEKARGLFTSFVKESGNNLLFLKCLEKIELYDLGNDVPYFTLEMYGLNENEFREARRSFREELEKLGKDLPETTIMTNFEAVVKTPTTEDHYIVVSSLSGSEMLSPKMKDLTSAENLHYSPYTGVAYCTKPGNNERSLGHIFCFLPLPETKRSMTGLPIHVNGFFDLEQNRRHLKEGTATGESSQTDESLLWNEGMISELLPESYHLLVTLMKEKCEREDNPSELVEEFYRLIPDPDEVHPDWKSLSSALYDRIIEENIFYTKQNGGKWIKHPEALFAVFGQDEMEIDKHMRSQNQESVKRFLLDCGENLVELPNHMIQVLKLSGHDPEEITPRLVRDKLKSSQCWQPYSNDDKFRLLSFVLEDNNYTDLADIQLLPLNTGGFTHFSNNSGMSHVFVVSDELARLFPGLEERFVSKGGISDDIWKSLQKMADEGLFQLHCLDNENFPGILHQTFEANCKKNDKERDVPQQEGMLDQSWIHEIWKEINSRDYSSLVSFENIPLIPIWQNSETGIEYLELKGRYMLSMFEEYEELPKAIQKVLELMDVFIFSPDNTMRFTHSEVIGKYIKLPTVDDVLKYLKGGFVSTEDTASCINESCNEEEKTDIFMYLTNHFTSIPPENFPLLKLLKIFKQSDNINDCEMVSYSENCTLVGSFEYPKELLFPRPLLMKISEQLIKHLGGHEIDQKSCISDVLDLMLADDSRYTTTDRTTLMVYLKDQSPDIVDHVLLKAKELQFIPSSDGNMHRVKELFDPSIEILKDLFDEGIGIFPDESFVSKHGFSISFLQRLGIKNADAVNTDHLVLTASKLDETQHDSLDENCQRKVDSLIHFLNKIQLDDRTLSELKDLKWVPVCTRKPEDYPDALNWCTKTPLDSPSEVKSLEYKNLIGSIAPLISIERINRRVVTYYMWNQPPEQQCVVEHFQNVIDSYNPKQNSTYIGIGKAILKYITDGELSQECIEKLQSMDCVLTNNKGFKPVERSVIEIDNCHINFSLEPYVFELATDLNDFKETYQTFGVKPSVDFEVLKSLLVTISEKYESREDSEYEQDLVRKDRALVVNILKAVISMGVDISQLFDVLVPINSTDDWLSFRPVEKCTYSSGNSSLSSKFDTDDDDEDEGEGGEEKVIYVHPDINSIAPKLGVASVTQRFMTSQNTTVLAWGQEEKLTTRISNLLDSYTDGFAVPKELIQNADDAGAKKVCFLFDERQNMEYRESLFDKGLAECQGPALWVYNDAIFQEKDFKNIIELGGKTKILETDKIGKFGLGFCSIYNLTDVPSFVSLNKLVILDPHLHHLGEAAIGNNPGLLIPLTKSCRRNFPDQLKPYSGVFGCDLSQQASQMYNGTLFRFPLRTHKQASNNEIKNLEYSRIEMIELLLKFVEAAANLLLFTQNVEEISVYHLDSKSKHPKEEMELLFKTWKNFSNENAVHGEYKYNILKEVKDAVSDHRENDIDLPLHVVDVSIEICDAAKKLSTQFDPSRRTVPWVISWGVGEQSFDLAYDLKAQGAIPVGCIAVPVEKKNGEFLRYTKMEDLHTGFYSKGRVFCFLPLPIETHLQVHINGCFMVEQDRKSLIRFNTDSKVNDGNTWNEAMLKDILQSAFINLLSSIATKINDTIMETNYWTLWPQVSENKNDESVSLLVRSVYQNILSSKSTVFYRSTDVCHGVVCSLEQSLFLDPEFRNLEGIGQSAFECMIKFHHDDECTVMDLPIEVYQNCQEAAPEHIDKLKRRMISKADFFERYFFPNIKDDYWSTADMKAKRNNLTLKAFEDGQLHKLLKEYECIPVKHSCILRRPSDLVLEDGSVSDMFDNNDERFPDDAFDMYRAILLTMGMMNKRISSELLIDRIKSVHMISIDDGLLRSKAVLKYLVTAIEDHLDHVHLFHNIPFLPAMETPTDWPLSWKGDDANEQFFAPEVLFSPTDKYIVGSVVYILDTGDKSIDAETLAKIGIQKPDIENVIEQMKVLGEANLTSSIGLENTCEQLYSLLDGYVEQNTGKVDIIKRLQSLQNKRIIQVDEELIEPSRVALSLPGGCCKPFLYEIHRNMKKFNMLWRLLGIPRYFEKSRFATLLQEQAKKNHNNKLHDDEILGIIRIVKNLCRSLKEYQSAIELEERSNIFLPDENCIMRCLIDVCYPEPDFDYSEEDVYIIHGEFTQDMINTLGIMSKRHLYLSRHSDSIPFGQKEKLTTRLKGIIDAYPKDHSVLNELLQNADDAAATEIHFIFDQRELPSANIFDKKWKQLQGPALCVFNNACFTEKDLKGIQNLGEGSKSDDPTKTGQFGVGFNAVYHLTDVPSFLTRGPSVPDGGTYCVFDPHCSYLPVARPEAPGMRLDLERFENKYNDVYKGYLQDVLHSEAGTWFRFPLRTTTMARESEIKKAPTGNTDMETLLSKMKDQMKRSLLFLTNIKKISISYIQKGSDDISNTVSVQLSVKESDTEKVTNFMSFVKGEAKSLKANAKSISEIAFGEVEYTATVNDTVGNIDTWLIVQTFGFKDKDDIPASIVDAYSKGELGFLPKGATAICASTKSDCLSGKATRRLEGNKKGDAFCVLPLPIQTGLPVHINGHFSLFANRNGLFDGKFPDDERLLWNRLLINQTIAHSYASCIAYARDTLMDIMENENKLDFLDAFLGCFPNIDKMTKSVWSELVFAVYKSIHERELHVFPVFPKYSTVNRGTECTNGEMDENEIRWVALESEEHEFKACFDNLQNIREETTVRQLLVDAGMKLTCAPLWIFKGICKAFANVTADDDDSAESLSECKVALLMSPKHAVSFLKSWKSQNPDKCYLNEVDIPVSGSLFHSVENLKYLLKYCLHSVVDFVELDGLPLLVSNNEKLVTFTSTEELILSKFCNLLPQSGDNFVHYKLVESLGTFKDSFRKLDISTFCSFLPLNLDPEIYQTITPIPWEDTQDVLPNRLWMKEFMNYLSTTETITQLGPWCLVPVLWYSNELTLVSFQMAFTACNFESFDQTQQDDRELVVALRQLGLPSVTTDTQNTKHVRDLFASKGNPENLAKCLVFHKNVINDLEVSINHSRRILTFFTVKINDIRFESVYNLRQLRIFRTITDKIVEVQSYARVIVVDIDSTSIVFEGLDELAELTNTVLLKHNAFHEDLYRVLNFEVLQKYKDRHKLTALYLDFILPNFDQLSPASHLVHLKFIKDKLLNQKFDDIGVKLRNLKFVPTTDRTLLKKANKFYSPHNTVFAKLCRPTEFPGYPFDQYSWKDFMEFSGMKTQVSKGQIIRFANQISNQGLKDESLYQSMELVGHLFSVLKTEMDHQFLTQIRQIKFIVPHLVSKEFSKVCPQFGSTSLIAFEESVPHTHFRVAWTLQNLLPSYAIPKNQSIANALNICLKPTTQTVISHIHKICSSLQESYIGGQSFITELMNKIYTYLEDLPESEKDGLKNRLNETPLIHIVGHGMFAMAKHVVLKADILTEIVPYLMIGSEEHGHHFALFRRLGSTDYVDLNHYIRILAAIKADTKDGQLSAPELVVTERAVRGLLSFLQFKCSETPTVNEPIFYLLSEKNILVESNKLVYADRYALKKRLEQQTQINFLKSMHTFEKENFDIRKCFSLLPTGMQPTKLTKIVEERLVTDENKMPWDVAFQLQNYVTSDLFVYAVIRLVITKYNKSSLSVSEDEKETISSMIKSLQFIALHEVKTILFYNNEKIENSDLETKLFFVYQNNTCYIEWMNLDFSKWISKHNNLVASVIWRLCSTKVDRRHVSIVLTNYENDAEEMAKLLDDLDVVALDYVPKDTSWIPPPGTPVPQGCLDILVQDLAEFAPGDYAVYEVFDNTDDDNEEAGDNRDQVAMYIYVKIAKKLTDDKFPLYEVNVGDGQLKKIVSYKLFKIKRSLSKNQEVELHRGGHSGHTEANRDKIFQEIEEALVDAWRISVEAFKKVLKRLLLQWHPDKNNNSAFCTEVTKHIINFAERLKSGKINVTDIPQYRERHGNRSGSDWGSYRQRWDEDIRRASESAAHSPNPSTYTFDVGGFAERVRRSHTSRGYNHYHGGYYYGSQNETYYPDPQPGLGTMWMRQAKCDIAAARTLLSDESELYNWVCVTCHQAAEKALKSIQYVRDSKKVNNNHCLMTTVAMGDPTLFEAVRALESLVGDYSRMRYPRAVFFPRIPSELYSKEQAEEALRLAEIIVSTCDDILYT